MEEEKFTLERKTNWNRASECDVSRAKIGELELEGDLSCVTCNRMSRERRIPRRRDTGK